MKIAQHQQDPKHEFSIDLKHNSYTHGGHHPPSLISLKTKNSFRLTPTPEKYEMKLESGKGPHLL
jgi:hypothetical protein